ncbi:MAG: NUDIX domain-containing protein, partial [Oscillospiraceae bacterium]|nr:NUDIX domain-containing protein [Oscillospiraceae bacterium]
MEKRIERCTMKAGDLKTGFGNPRKITRKKLDELKESMDEFGDFGIYLIDEKNNVIGGNQRLKVVMEYFGPDQDLDCKRLIGYTKAELRAINIKDNTHSGDWDLDLLADWTADMTVDLGLKEAQEKEVEERIIPEMELIHYEKYDYVMIVCRNELDYNNLVRALGIEGAKVKITPKRKINARAVWYEKMKTKLVPLDYKGYTSAAKQKASERKAAKTENSSTTQSSSSSGAQTHTVTHGKDISSSYTGKRDTKSVVHAQGYDGLPKVVSQEDFDKAVKASSFIAQRTYTASSQDILDEYQKMLYDGDFYVDCTVGGAQYGQGMYCAADYNGELTSGIRSEMKHYQDIGTQRSLSDARAEYIKGLTSEDFADSPYMGDVQPTGEETAVFTKLKSSPDMKVYDLPADERNLQRSMVNSGKWSSMCLALDDMTENFAASYKPATATETLTMDPSAKVVTYSDLVQMKQSEGDKYVTQTLADYAKAKGPECEAFYKIQQFGKATNEDFSTVLQWKSTKPKEYQEAESFRIETLKKKEKVQAEVSSMDDGAYAAMHGYDAINAQGHGASGSYTVILNRTKVVLLDGRSKNDGVDEGSISWKPASGGRIYAIRDGKVIGWVDVSYVRKEAETDSRADEGNSNSGNHNIAKNPSKSTSLDANDEDNPFITRRPKNGSVGVLVVRDGCILSGIRKSGFNPGLVCGPGGHIEDGETHEQAAIRETQEEFGITPTDLIQIGYGPWEPDTGLKPAVYLATEYEGKLRNTDGEMGNLRFRSLEELQEMDKAMFQPFADAIELLLKVIGSDHFDGGPGSGNHGHKGVKGQRGGSAPSGKGTTTVASTAKRGSDFYPENSYTDTPDYKEASTKAAQTRKTVRALRERRKQLETALKAEMKVKPRSEWTNDDEIDALLGEKPATYT